MSKYIERNNLLTKLNDISIEVGKLHDKYIKAESVSEEDNITEEIKLKAKEFTETALKIGALDKNEE